MIFLASELGQTGRTVWDLKSEPLAEARTVCSRDAQAVLLSSMKTFHRATTPFFMLDRFTEALANFKGDSALSRTNMSRFLPCNHRT